MPIKIQSSEYNTSTTKQNTSAQMDYFANIYLGLIAEQQNDNDSGGII